MAAIVGIKAEVPADARTADTLGRQRSGTGVVIDSGGLVLTIGYLILEATSVDLYPADGKRDTADIVAYDHETGLGLVRATLPLGGAPIRLGSSKDVAVGDPLLVLSRDGALAAARPSWPAGASSPASGSISCPMPCSRPRRMASSPAPR